MLKKLLKYDLKYMLKSMIAFYVLAIFFAILTRILFSLEQTVIVNIIGQISVGCMFSMVASILFNTVIRSLVRFKDSIYKDEAYLTHTLPVTKTQIYESRFLQFIIFSTCGFLVMVLSLFITYYTKERWINIKEIINSVSTGLNLSTSFIVISIILVFFLEVLNLLQNGFLGLIIGYRKNNNKIAYSFLFGFISYMLTQMFVVLCIFIVGIFNANIMTVFNTNSIINTETIRLLAIISIFIYSIVIVIMNVICSKQLEKGVDVE